uniref:CCHC-type domain-containing protein n=1 Tax=Ditylenchus dipsaci TaxID=166011 RepID=A0A915EMC6_9BILA
MFWSDSDLWNVLRCACCKSPMHRVSSCKVDKPCIAGIDENNKMCFYCKERGHWGSTCPLGAGKEIALPPNHCFTCAEKGHSYTECPSGQPPVRVKSRTSGKWFDLENEGNASERLVVKAYGKEGMACYRCAQNGHFSYECPSFRCFKCGGLGHLARNCETKKLKMRGLPSKEQVNFFRSQFVAVVHQRMALRRDGRSSTNRWTFAQLDRLSEDSDALLNFLDTHGSSLSIGAARSVARMT